MITITEVITVTRDEPMAKMYDEVYTKENGWSKEECTVSVTYRRIQWLGGIKIKEKEDE